MLKAISIYARQSVRIVLEIRSYATPIGLAVALIFSSLLIAFASLSLSALLSFATNGRVSLEGALLMLFALPLIPHWVAALIILFEDYFVLFRLRRVVFGDQPLFRERFAKWSAKTVEEDEK